MRILSNEWMDTYVVVNSAEKVVFSLSPTLAVIVSSVEFNVSLRVDRAIRRQLIKSLQKNCLTCTFCMCHNLKNSSDNRQNWHIRSVNIIKEKCCIQRETGRINYFIAAKEC